MSKGAPLDDEHLDDEQEPRGPNLPLLYSLIALALAAAIGLALMIVMPFYHRH
jgi:hypothetical protein